MIKTTYSYPRDLAIRAQLENIKPHIHLFNNFKHYISRFGMMGFIVYILDRHLGNGIEIYLVILAAVLCSILFSLTARNAWITEISTKNGKVYLDVTLDDEGVRARSLSDETVTKWSDYEWYEEGSDYIRIKWMTGIYTYVPINEQTKEAIEFTKTKLKMKPV